MNEETQPEDIQFSPLADQVVQNAWDAGGRIADEDQVEPNLKILLQSYFVMGYVYGQHLDTGARVREFNLVRQSAMRFLGEIFSKISTEA